MQTTSKLLLVRSKYFGFNRDTEIDNVFQNAPAADKEDQMRLKALEEFDAYVQVLKRNNLNVIVFDENELTEEKEKEEAFSPDSIFPNNWISFHAAEDKLHGKNAKICLYPMFSPKRRVERNNLTKILSKLNLDDKSISILDFTSYESDGKFLEGTGSLVLDRENKIAYASISQRTDEEIFNAFCSKMGYSPILFGATDQDGKPIYHTNVLMCLADKFAILALESISSKEDQVKVTNSLKSTNKEIIEISHGQMNAFCGNILQVHNDLGEKLLIASSQAFDSLNLHQKEKIKGFNNKIIFSNLETAIEKIGGGSARCMICEVFI